ncbi:MAG: hypothetical protein RSA95_14430 [Citrobacter sp.]|uniref:hypothetical protein n=1 Tax=Citrobacter sp. TaxID=1896336 RepID=UPI002FC6863F
MNNLALSPPFASSHLVMMTKVSARDEWVDTHLFVVQGAMYFFRATGQWWDAFIRCDANGYNLWYMNPARDRLRCQMEAATWFTLIGAIEESTDTMFVIGDGTRFNNGWIAPGSGRLMVFANDMPGMYWNNFASITLEIWQ